MLQDFIIAVMMFLYFIITFILIGLADYAWIKLKKIIKRKLRKILTTI